MNDFLLLLIVCCLVVIFMEVSEDDYQQKTVEQQHYCNMVDLWEQDTIAQLPPYVRRGWPPYHGKEMCDE